ncbi:MAG: DUF5916 domain-containing protein [Bacteroidota bacterium]
MSQASLCFFLVLLSLGASLVLSSTLVAQSAFPPPDTPAEIYATQVAKGVITLDGILDEPTWQRAEVVSGFTQRDPLQGEAATVDTEVRILFNATYLYLGAICYDSLTDRRRVRVRNMQRDFNAYGNDRFGVALDGLMDQRNAVGFEVTPYGSQREVQVIDGDEFDGNDSWDALWYVRTQITDSAWIAEIAIPWKTLRYQKGSRKMLISFSRNIRRNNEITTWPAYPRAFSHFRMAYAAVLKGVQPPPPSANLQINPYLLGDIGRTQEGELPQENIQEVKVGGEFKWAITPNAVLDGTINTDFAQADVDQQVQNLSRFSVLFPERRQFFLENANIFRTSSSSFIQPFFSRRIGLDNNGQPIPLDGGLRFTSQTQNQTSGVLAMRQRATDTSPTAHFAVGRYVRNFSNQSRLGGMVTFRRDEAFENGGLITPAQTNVTATINSFLRPRQSLSWESMLSVSTDSEAEEGLATHSWLWQQKNWGYLGLIGQYVSPNYLPGTGFLALSDYILVSPAIDLDLRPKWLPAFVRSFGPDTFADIFWRASDRTFQQAIAEVSPLDLEFQTGGQFEIRFRREWQQLDDTFRPLGIAIAPGFYAFSRANIRWDTDFSKRIAGGIGYQTGGYYNGQLHSWETEVRLSPIPHIEFTGSYEYNQIRQVGELQQDLNAHLLFTRSRLALNPRIQLIGSYQWNSATQTDIWNVRLSWEYQPLSFIYVVFNSNQSDDLFPENRYDAQELIGKVTYLRQF